MDSSFSSGFLPVITTSNSFGSCSMARAFYFHPLFFTPPVILLVILLKKRIKPAFYKGFIFTMIALYVIVYLYRMIWGDHQVVVFEPAKGCMVLLIQKILS